MAPPPGEGPKKTANQSLDHAYGYTVPETPGRVEATLPESLFFQPLDASAETG